MGSPQFETQDDLGLGCGISTIPQWYSQSAQSAEVFNFSDLFKCDLDSPLTDIIDRLRMIFHIPDSLSISTTDLHDLTCFVLHRLLLLSPSTNSMSECLRFATCVYMFIIHGPTYYYHAVILKSLILKLKIRLEFLPPSETSNALSIWLLFVGMTGAIGTEHHNWFVEKLRVVAIKRSLRSWDDVEPLLQTILWMKTTPGSLFQQAWLQATSTLFAVQ